MSAACSSYDALKMLRKVIITHAPYVFTGPATRYCLVVIVASEMLTSAPGVGFLWQEYNSRVLHILLSILTISVIGFRSIGSWAWSTPV
jgi:ABC-type nitrate/sulfonate/bicarbonate transport system permease component